MNHTQIEKNNMYGKTNKFFDDQKYSDVWKSFKRLADEVATFKTDNATLAGYIQQHQTNTSGVTQTKNVAFADMIGLVVKASQKAYVWALDNSDHGLAELFDVQTPTLMRGKETNSYARVKNIRDSLTRIIDSLQGVEVTPADLAAINTAIAAYEAAIGTTGTVQSHKTAGTIGIVDMQKKMDTSLVIIDNLMVSHFQEKAPEMVKEYLLNRVVDKMPVHHSGVSIHVTDAATGEELQGAVLSVNGKSATTDIDGDAEIIKILPDTYIAVISLNGYITQSPKVVIDRGKVTELEVKLVKG